MASLSDAITLAIDKARAASNGRHAELIVHDGPLRQTVIALKKGVRLGEHNSPPAASMQVIRGNVKITGEDPVVIGTGFVEALTHQRHGVEALEDSVFLLTTVTSVPGADSHGGPGTLTGEIRMQDGGELSASEQAEELRESDQQTGGGRIDG
jgi:quercetin dioxygenase-like cupin family protein